MRCGRFWRRVEANKFADWTWEEFEALVLPNRGSPTRHPTLQSMRQQGASIRLHQAVLAKTMLPSTVDWRGTPADSPVKDQAACGSCWVSLPSVLCIPPAYPNICSLCIGIIWYLLFLEGARDLQRPSEETSNRDIQRAG